MNLEEMILTRDPLYNSAKTEMNKQK